MLIRRATRERERERDGARDCEKIPAKECPTDVMMGTCLSRVRQRRRYAVDA